MKTKVICAALALLSLQGGGVWAAETAQEHAMPGHHHKHRAAKKDEGLVDFFWRKSDDAFHAGDYPRAIGLHKSIVILAPAEIESYSVGAWLMWSLGNGDQALAFLQQGLKANPNNPEMWDAAAQHYDLQKRTGEARDAYVKAVELAGDRADQMLRRRLAHAAETTGDWDLAAKTWRALVRDFPTEAVNQNNLARVEEAMKTGANPTTTALLGMGIGALALVPLYSRRKRV